MRGAERHCVRARIRLSNQLALENLVGYLHLLIFYRRSRWNSDWILACEMQHVADAAARIFQWLTFRFLR
jgi:hypothetical protein